MKNIKFVCTVFLFVLSIIGNAQTEKPQLIYVMDPQCSWCYSNSGNIEEIANALEGKVDVDLKVAGMWLGNKAPQGGATYFETVTQHLPPMIAKTGADIGTGYYDLASDSSYTFSSLEPAAAIVLVRTMHPKKAVVFAKNVERALFVDGKRLDRLDTYLEILKKLDIDSEEFEKEWMGDDNLSKTKADFGIAKKLVTNFPTLLLQQGTKTQVLGVGYFTKEEILPKIEAALAQ
ncbi:MAG TPA: DsbA family protein [Leeuwenhoekiella sp.]|nr:DsbA family protein [Leeuwenhoekiella sp.]